MNYTHINANGTTNIVVARGARLHAVAINTKGAAANTLTLTDGPGGTVIAVIDTVNLNTNSLIYDIDTTVGLVAVMATGTAADVTIASS